jgi:hypothetical protein
MGGSNDAENLVRLPCREHYMAHLLLIKIYPDNTRLLYAVNKMMLRNKYQSNRVFKFNSHLYKSLREKQYDARRKVQSGNYQIYNINTGEVRWCLNGIIPDGWKYGTNLKNTLGKVRYYNKDNDYEIMLGKNDSIPSGFTKGRRPVRYIFDKNGNKKSYDRDDVPEGWYRECPRKVKLVNIFSGDVITQFDVDQIPENFLLSNFSNNRKICCTHLITKSVATLTDEEYKNNWKWFRTNIFNKGVNSVYMTDVGVVRDSKHYYQLTNRSINFKKYIETDYNFKINQWLIKMSNLPTHWLNKSFIDLGFYLIPKSDFIKY